MRPWAGYRRVSRVGDRDERLVSPELQAGRIESYASARGLAVEMLEPELDVSGGKLERPILSEALEGIESGRFAGVIVAQLDRLSRLGMLDAFKLWDRIEGAGGEIIAVAENLDTSTPAGRMQRNMLLAISNYALEGYSAQFAAAKIRAVQQGIWPFPYVPIGYRKEVDRRLGIDPREGPTVVKAFQLRATGAPWSAIADLLGKGISGAGKVIRNRVYLGEVRIDKLGVVNRSAHPALVERALWEAAQISHPRPPRSDKPALLSGLVRCAACSRLMTPDLQKGRRLYRCFARNAAGRCPEPAIITAALVEPVVERTLLAHVEVIAKGQPSTDQLADAQRVLDVAEAELTAFQQATEAAGDPEHFTEGLQQRVEAVEKARGEVGQLRATEVTEAETRRLSESWPSLGVEQRRHVLRGALGAVWVRKGRGPGRVRLTARGFEPSDLSRGPLGRVDWDAIPGEIPVAEDFGEG